MIGWYVAYLSNTLHCKKSLQDAWLLDAVDRDATKQPLDLGGQLAIIAQDFDVLNWPGGITILCGQLH